MTLGTNGTQHKLHSAFSVVMPSVNFFIVMLNSIVLNVIVLAVVMLSVATYNRFQILENETLLEKGIFKKKRMVEPK